VMDDEVTSKTKQPNAESLAESFVRGHEKPSRAGHSHDRAMSFPLRRSYDGCFRYGFLVVIVTSPVADWSNPEMCS
jgi:hypothetical protein